MKIKTLSIEGKQENVYDDTLGSHPLYSNGSKRTVIAYFLFPKTIDGEKRRGFQIIEQKASIENASSSAAETIYYNKWENERFIDFFYLQYIYIYACTNNNNYNSFVYFI